MSAYRTIVVGTDGSSTSLAAVERAAAVAGDSAAELLIVCAYTPATRDETASAEDALKEEAYLVRGWTPAEETLRTAEDRASAPGRGTSVPSPSTARPPTCCARPPRRPAPICWSSATRASTRSAAASSARCPPTSLADPVSTC